MEINFLNELAHQLNYDLVPFVEDFASNCCHPKRDDQLIDAFETLDLLKISSLLSGYANGNQTIFLNDLLINKIIEAQYETVINHILKKSRCEILFDRFYTPEEKNFLLAIRDTNVAISQLDLETTQNLVKRELEKDFAGEFNKNEKVSLIWVAIFLKNATLTRELLNAKRPADFHSPFKLSLLQGNASDLRYLASFKDWYEVGFKYLSKDITPILKCFLETSINDSLVFDQRSCLAPYIAVELGDLELMQLLIDQDIEINSLLGARWYPFHLFNEQRIPIHKVFPTQTITPLSIALFKKDEQMLKLLLANNASIAYLSGQEKRKLANIFGLEFFY